MQIADVESIVAGSTYLVRITTDTGLVGWGQGACWGYPAATAAIVDTFREYLVGQDPGRIEHHWNYLYRMAPFRGSVLSAAVSAVDIALWDIKGQRLQAPIWDLLGGKCRDKIRLHLLMGGESPEDIANNSRAAVAEGFTAIKFDPLPAGFEDLSLDGMVQTAVDRVGAAREAIGSSADIIVELHRKLTPLQSGPLCDALDQFRPLFIEDPIQIDSIQSQADLAGRMASPLANGERMNTIWEFRELLAGGGSQFVRPDVGLAGGISHCRKIAALAESYHAAVVTHNFLGPLLTAAAVHLDASIPNFVVQEYSKLDEAAFGEAFPGRLTRTGGYLELPDAPGLGVRVDADKVKATAPRLIQPGHGGLRADGSVARAV